VSALVQGLAMAMVMALEPEPESESESALVQGLGLRLALGLQPESVLFVAVGRLATVVTRSSPRRPALQ